MVKDFLLALLKNIGYIAMIAAPILILIALSCVIPIWVILTSFAVGGLIAISWNEAKEIAKIRKQTVLISKISELESECCVIKVKLNQCCPESEEHLKFSLRIGELTSEIDDLYSQLDKLY